MNIVRGHTIFIENSPAHQHYSYRAPPPFRQLAARLLLAPRSLSFYRNASASDPRVGCADLQNDRGSTCVCVQETVRLINLL